MRAWVLFRRNRGSPLGIEAELIVHLPFFAIGKDIVGFLYLLELFFRRFVAGIQVWMIPAGKFSVGLANLFLAGLAAHAQQFVIILFGCGRHNCHSLAKTKRPRALKLSPAGIEVR